MALKFVPYDPKRKDDEETLRQKTEIRSHASSRGILNRKRAKASQLGTIALDGQLSVVNPIQAAINSLIPAKVKIRVTVKSKRPSVPSLSRKSSSTSRSVASYDSATPETEMPSPERQISAELNAPRYLYMWSQQLFPGFSEFTKCFNIQDVQAISAIRPYLDYEVFESTLASLSHGLTNFHAGSHNLASKEVLSHRGNAIALLRSHLVAGQTHGAVLLAILYMTLLEMLLDQTEAAETHKKILRHLIQQQGGLESLDEHVISNILQQDQYWIDIGLEPLIEPPSLTPILEYPSVEDVATLQDAITHLPLGFRHLASKGEIATCNLEFLFRITELHRDRHNRSIGLSCSQQSIPLRSTSHRYRSLLDALPVLGIPDSDDIIFQKFLSLALVVYSTICLNKPPVFMHHLTQARAELTAKLPSFAKHLTPFYHQEQCLFWIWHIAVTSWELEAEGIALQTGQRERFKAFYDTNQTDMILKNFSWEVNVI